MAGRVTSFFSDSEESGSLSPTGRLQDVEDSRPRIRLESRLGVISSDGDSSGADPSATSDMETPASSPSPTPAKVEQAVRPQATPEYSSSSGEDSDSPRASTRRAPPAAAAAPRASLSVASAPSAASLVAPKASQGAGRRPSSSSAASSGGGRGAQRGSQPGSRSSSISRPGGGSLISPPPKSSAQELTPKASPKAKARASLVVKSGGQAAGRLSIVSAPKAKSRLSVSMSAGTLTSSNASLSGQRRGSRAPSLSGDAAVPRGSLRGGSAQAPREALALQLDSTTESLDSTGVFELSASLLLANLVLEKLSIEQRLNIECLIAERLARPVALPRDAVRLRLRASNTAGAVQVDARMGSQNTDEAIPTDKMQDMEKVLAEEATCRAVAQGLSEGLQALADVGKCKDDASRPIAVVDASVQFSLVAVTASKRLAMELEWEKTSYREEAMRWKQKALEATKRIDELQEAMEESEQSWAHQQRHWNHKWEVERAAMLNQIREWGPMFAEDERASLQRVVLKQVQLARESIANHGSELVKSSEQLSSENASLVAEVRDLDAKLQEEHGTLQDLQTEVRHLKSEEHMRHERETQRRGREEELRVAQDAAFSRLRQEADSLLTDRNMLEARLADRRHAEIAAARHDDVETKMRCEAEVAESQRLVAQLRAELAASEVSLFEAGDRVGNVYLSEELSVAMGELTAARSEHRQAAGSLATELERKQNVQDTKQEQRQMMNVCGALEQRVVNLGEQMRSWQVERTSLEKLLSPGGCSQDKGHPSSSSRCSPVVGEFPPEEEQENGAVPREQVTKYLALRLGEIAEHMEAASNGHGPTAHRDNHDFMETLRTRNEELVRRISDFNSLLHGAEVQSWSKRKLGTAGLARAGLHTPPTNGLSPNGSAFPFEDASPRGVVKPNGFHDPAADHAAAFRSSSEAVGSLLRQVRGLSETAAAAVASGGAGQCGSHGGLSLQSPASLKALEALERQAGRLERANHEWASLLFERGRHGHDAVDVRDEDRQCQAGLTGLTS
eukprot:TRINITY_DN47115_c0_g1_i1.p1 TRINITY_DN47115_c0_g1~~TRINITY_DN47115_c0_g1_i1.p1  ORF type:complete len:1022 (-),score=249.75 TRINITY_DN47115_c0_g1_i1:60-3125(-)